MFLRQLSSSGSSFLPRSHPVLCRVGFRSSCGTSSHLLQFPTPYPWSVQGVPPWPPHLPAAYQVFSGSLFHPRNINLGNLTGSRCSFYTSATLMMERPDRDREPPHKRRKSEEEKRSMEGWQGHRGGSVGSTAGKNGGSKREQQRADSSTDRGSRPNHYFKDGSRDRGSNESERGVSKENSRGNDVGWTRTRDKHRNWKDSADQDETLNRGTRMHQRGWHKDPQPARTQTSQSEPEQGKGPQHKHNPWFRGRGGCERERGGRETQVKDRCSDGGPWAELLTQPFNKSLPQSSWQEAGANRQPLPPGTCPPAGQQESMKPLQRHWESPACSTDIQPPGGRTAFDFSVMSYNVLSQELLQDNAYLYRHCNPAILNWSHRLPNLLAEIRQHDADILCLQEVQEDHYESQIKPALQALGYQCEYKKRTGRKPDGCAVIFKSSRLSLLSSRPVEFLRPGDALLDRDNVGLVVLLQPNDAAARSDPSTFICVANTHLLYNPRRGDIKLAQLAILLAELSRLSRLPDGSTSPVVLCGDFNSTPWSPLYSFLTTGRLHYSGLQIGSVSGQESSPRGQRLLTAPIWSESLGIDRQCRYKNKTAESSPSSPTAVEGAISNLSVEDLATTAASNSAKIEHGLKLQSSYQHRLMPDGRPEITTCHSRTAMTVDYILYTPEFTTPPTLPGGRGLHLLDRLSLVGHSELEKIHGLPNLHHSSDHLPLLARFRLWC